MDKTIKLLLLSLTFNITFSLYHVVMGVLTQSWWLITVGVYYVILSALRSVILLIKKKIGLAKRLVGAMLMAMSIPLVGTVVLSAVRERGIVFHEIVMIAIAAYSFTKITLAIINLIKARNKASTRLIMLRNISLADAFVSIFSLQRSMLVSFDGMTELGIRVMNIATGSAVCLIVFLLGFNLVCKIPRKDTSFD